MAKSFVANFGTVELQRFEVRKSFEMPHPFVADADIAVKRQDAKPGHAA